MNKIKVANDYLISIGICDDIQFDATIDIFYNHYEKKDADKVVEMLTKHKIPYKIDTSHITNGYGNLNRLYISVIVDDLLVIRRDNLINKIYE